MFNGTIEERAEQAETLLSQVAPGAVCIAQDWDNRIDCLLKLRDGRVVGEMVAVSQLTEQRIRATGERLRQWGEGVEVPLVDELLPPVRIASAPRS
jgi:hypothetical protein